jgi:hypothetical protein
VTVILSTKLQYLAVVVVKAEIAKSADRLLARVVASVVQVEQG